MRAIHLMDMLQVLAMLFFVALMQFMGRLWSRYHLAITVGLGLNSACLVIWIIAFLKSRAMAGPLSTAPPIANAFAFLVWLVAFLRPEKRSAPVAPVRHEVLDQTRAWEAALKETLGISDFRF